MRATWSRKTYRAVADAIKRCPDSVTCVTRSLADLFASDNVRFRRAMFYAAAGRDDNGNTPPPPRADRSTDIDPCDGRPYIIPPNAGG